MRHTPACDTRVLGGKLPVHMVITVISSSGNEANQVYPLVKTENSDFFSFPFITGEQTASHGMAIALFANLEHIAT